VHEAARCVIEWINRQHPEITAAEYLINILNKRSNGEVKLLRDSLAEGSIASCVRNGKQHAIDGFILNLPSIDEEDFKFEKRNEKTDIIYCSMERKIVYLPKLILYN